MSETVTRRFEVGQRVWIRSVNGRGRPAKAAHVVKVGRTLVTVDSNWYGPGESVYRIDTGYQNDQYSHQWIVTDEQKAAEERREPLLAYLREKRIYDLDRAGLSVDALEQIVAIMRSDLPAPVEGPS